MADIGVAKNRDDEVLLERTGFRLSWGAVFAGFVVATTIHIVLSVLGVAVGFTTWDVGDPARDLGMGLGIWMAISALVALYVGGLTTGRLAGVLTRGDGALHGVLVWGLATLVNLWLLASGAGMLLGGAFGMVERTVAATAGGIASGVGRLGEAAMGQAGEMDVAALQREIEAALGQTGVPELQPETLRADIEQVRGTAVSGADNRALAREIANLVRTRAGAVDREAVVNVIVARTGMTRPEAEQAAARVESAVARARTGVAAGMEQVEEAAVDVAETAADALGRAAWWTLLALVLGVAAAAWGAASTARQ